MAMQQVLLILQIIISMVIAAKTQLGFRNLDNILQEGIQIFRYYANWN
jgi:hypothetical protein